MGIFPSDAQQGRIQDFGQGGQWSFDPRGESPGPAFPQNRGFALKLPETPGARAPLDPLVGIESRAPQPQQSRKKNRGYVLEAKRETIIGPKLQSWYFGKFLLSKVCRCSSQNAHNTLAGIENFTHVLAVEGGVRVHRISFAGS